MLCNILRLTRAQIDNVISKDFLHTTPHGAMKGKTQIKRNIERFPERFRFQLTDKEKDKLVANCDRFERMKHSSVNPCVYTEQGVAQRYYEAKWAHRSRIWVKNGLVSH